MNTYDSRLYPFQVEGVEFIERAGGRCIIGDEMGLGKTVQALAWRAVQPEIKRTLIVTPVNVMGKWREEVSKWTKGSAHIVKGYTAPLTSARTLIVSYNVMTKRFRELKTWGPELIIWDEAHYLKGYRKKVQRVAAALLLKSPFVLFLSGTPFLNRPIELFNMLDMAQPGKWNLGSYGVRYCGGFDYWAGPLMGAMHLNELRSRLNLVMIRRLKRDVWKELPELTRIRIRADIRTEEYFKALAGINRKNAMVKVMQAWHILGQEKAKVAIEWVKEYFEQADAKSKIVLYAHHLDVIDTLKNGLAEFGAFNIDGRVPPTKRDALMKGFQTGLRPRVAIINEAGGEGVDLFGLGEIDSSRILFVERQWTPGREEQGEGRLDRIGQKNAVEAYYLTAIGTFDEPMDAKIENKRKIIKATIPMEEIEMQVQGEIINSLLLT